MVQRKDRRYEVRVPRRLSVSGKRESKYFRTKEQAQEFIRSFESEQREHGRQAITATERRWIGQVAHQWSPAADLGTRKHPARSSPLLRAGMSCIKTPPILSHAIARLSSMLKFSSPKRFGVRPADQMPCELPTEPQGRGFKQTSGVYRQSFQASQ
jgi:hypothetical protein